MGDFSIDPFDGMSDGEILSEDIDRQLNEIATDLDGLLTGIDDQLGDEFRSSLVEQSQLEWAITSQLDDELGQVNGDVVAITERLREQLDSEIVKIANDAEFVRRDFLVTDQQQQGSGTYDSACSNYAKCRNEGTSPNICRSQLIGDLKRALPNADDELIIQLVEQCEFEYEEGEIEEEPPDVPPGEPQPAACGPNDFRISYTVEIGGPVVGDHISIETGNAQFPTIFFRPIPPQPTCPDRDGHAFKVKGRLELGANGGKSCIIIATGVCRIRDVFCGIKAATVELCIPCGACAVPDPGDQPGQFDCYLDCETGETHDAPSGTDILPDSWALVGDCATITQADIERVREECGAPPAPPDGPDVPGDDEDEDEDEPDIGRPRPGLPDINLVDGGDCEDVLPAGPVLEGINNIIEGVARLFGFEDGFVGRWAREDFSLEALAEDVISAIQSGNTHGSIVGELYGKAAEKAGCSPGLAALMSTGRTILGFFNLITGGALKEQMVALDQLVASQCPTGIPTASEALSAYLANEIDERSLECLVRANNLVWKDWRNVAESARQKWDMPTLIAFRRRGRITEDEYRFHARRIGWLDTDEAERLWEISPQLPFQSDLIRMLVRDTDDPNIVDRFKLDAEFDNKFGGQLKEWAEWQGVSEKVMRYNWRAHWRILSPTQLFDWLFKTGREADGSFNQEKLDDVRTALKQDDVLPFWVDPLINSQFSLPRITQIASLARAGLLDEQETREQYYKRGLETHVANALAMQATRDAEQNYANHQLTKAYARGELNEQELKQELTKLGAGDKAIAFAIERGKLLMHMEQKDSCLKALKRAVLAKEMTRDEAAVRAVAVTNDSDQAGALADQWECEAEFRLKKDSASELCGWFREGLLGRDEFNERLIGIGYTTDDASRVTERCYLQLQRKEEADKERDRRQEEAKRRREEAERRRLEREAERERLREEREAERELDEAEREQRREESERDRAAKARQRAARKQKVRRERVARAAKTFCNRNECDLSDADEVMWRYVSTLQRNGVATLEHLTHLALTVAQSKQVATLEQWQQEVDQLLIFDGAVLA